MTEDEAKAKWCPFARVVETGEYSHDKDAAFNRIDNCDHRGDQPITDTVPHIPELNLLPTTLCIGSACMAWRDLFETVNAQEVVDHFDRTGRATALGQLRKSGGYCGLAGKP